MRQIHGRYSDGQYVTGVEVFREIYSRIGFERLVAPTRWFIFGPLLDVGYSLFAWLRYHHAMRRIKKIQSAAIRLKCDHSCSPIASEAGDKSFRKKQKSPGFFNSQIRKRFENLTGGNLTLVDEFGKTLLGSMPERDQDLSATVIVSDQAFYRRVLFGGTIGEQIFDYHIRHVDFIRKYVFPGGCLPSVSALAKSIGRATDLRMLHQEDITPHYATTLTCWRNEFIRKLDRVRDLGYDESFIRLWQFYLCYCEAAFAERRVHNIHVMFAKPKCPINPAADPHLPINSICQSYSNDASLTRDTAFSD